MATESEWLVKVEAAWVSIQAEPGYFYLRLFRWDFERG